MNIFFALRMFREMRYRPYCFVISSPTQSIKKVFYYIYTKIDNKQKERNRVDKYRSKYKKKGRGFHGYKSEKVATTPTQSESMHMQDGEGPDLFLSAVGKTEKELFVVEDVENLETINKIVPIAVNSNSYQGPSISGVVSL